ncbi:MAG: acid shock protein [Clostridia bacterium]|nr:acid shock protein [Clostridia bacterium]
MKKIFATVLALAMLLSFASCAAEDKATATTPEADTTVETKGEPASDKTVGQTLLDAFKASKKTTAQDIADELMQNSVIQFMGGTIPVEEGLLTGFENTEIKGFKEGVMFAPMIGVIPFVGYVFDLADGTDVEEFKKTLSDSANLRWNICVSADEKIVENKDNMVFFLMCPESFEQPEEETPDMGGMALGEEDQIPAADGEMDQVPAADGEEVA